MTDHGYVLVARQGDRFDNLLNQLPNDGRIKYLSMWNGYFDEAKAAYNPALAKSVGNVYRYMHTSGHCDMKSLYELFSELDYMEMAFTLFNGNDSVKLSYYEVGQL